MSSVPDVKDNLESGALNLTTLTKVAKHIKAEERRIGDSLPMQERIELLQAVKHLSSERVDETLMTQLPEAHREVLKRDHERRLSLDETRLSITLTQEQMGKLKRA